MEQNAQGECGRGITQSSEHHQRVRPNVALRMKLGRLRHALHRFDLRQHLLEQPRFVQKLESAARVPFREDFHDLVTHAFDADFPNLGREVPDRSERGWIERKPEARGEAHGAEHPQAVLA